MRDRLLFVAGIVAGVVGCAGFHRSTATSACRSPDAPLCRQSVGAVAADCRAGDPVSCRLACRLDSTEANCSPACDKGSAESCHDLARALSGGLLVSSRALRPNKPRAAMLLRKACEGGVGEACYSLGSLALREELPPLSATDLEQVLLQGCGKGDGASCFIAGARALAAGRPSADVLPWVRTGCESPSSELSADGHRNACNLLTCLTDAKAPEAARQRRDLCAAADNAFAFSLPWASVGGKRLVTGMPWMLDATSGGIALGALPRGTRWFCADGAAGLSLCARTEAQCNGLRAESVEHSPAGTNLGSCGHGPPTAACVTYVADGLNRATCTRDEAASCQSLRERISRTGKGVTTSPCYSVGELF